MQVVILCGGLGTRLREETEYRPKPMVPVGGRPILWHIMKSYAAHGHKDFILCLGYKGEVIKNYFLNYKASTSDLTIHLGSNSPITYHNAHDEEDWNVTLVDTGAETQTGGRLKRAIRHVTGDKFLCSYGDGVSNVDINAVIDQHNSANCIATLTGVRPSGRFGELELEENKVVSFNEKPDQDEYFINGGFFVFNREIDNYLDGDPCILERSPFERLAAEGQLGVYRHQGFWQCMDTFRELQILDKMWADNTAPWKIWQS